ncbi:unnamed protein product [Dicrocoelium dendriticum]|nr:unnamed protein product [Dicrocoelium dendriticum]
MVQNVVDSPEDGLSAEFFSKDGIFSLEPFQLFKPTSLITNAQVAGNHIIAATVKNSLLRISPGSPPKVSEIEISRASDDRVHNLFLDHMGWHAIISMQSGTNFYVNRSLKKVRPLAKAKDMLLDSVAWNKHNKSESSTQEILIGTNDGLIFETVLLSDEGRFISNAPEQYWRQVTNLGHSVTGLEIIRHPPGSASVLVGEPQRCVVLATTPSRMYQFAGWINSNSTPGLLSHLTQGSPPQTTAMNPPLNISATNADTFPPAGPGPVSGLFPNAPVGIYHGVFNQDDKLPVGCKVTEFPQSFGYSDLKLYQPSDAELPTKFAWMTGPGIYFGHLDVKQMNLPPFTTIAALTQSGSPIAHKTTTSDQHSDRSAADDDISQPSDVFAGRVVSLTRNTKLIPYPVIRMLEHTSAPLGVCLTAFHLIIAYADRVKAVNILDDRTVYSMPVSAELNNASALGICRDSLSGHIWLFGNQGMARLNVRNELSRVWQIYLERKQFDEARKFCQTESQLDVVNTREAEYCFEKGDFMNSAKLFAKTSAPFEEVALRFSRLSLLQHAPRSDSPLISTGLAVRDDHDLMDALIEDVAKSYPFASAGPALEFEATCGPLKALVSTKLECLYSRKPSPASDGGALHAPSLGGTALPDSAVSGQIALLTLWMSELLLNEIGFLRDRLSKRVSADDQARLETVQHEFRTLLSQPDSLKVLPNIVPLLYELIDNHANNEELVFVAELTRDYERLVDHYVKLSLHKEALATLASEDTVNTWIRLGRRLDPAILLSAIMVLPPEQSMRYLRYVVERLHCTDRAIHHLLVSLCAEASTKIPHDESADCLMSYLELTSAKAIALAEFEGRSQLKLDEPEVTAHKDAPFDGGSYVTSTDADFMSLPTFDESILSALPYDPGFVLRTCKEVSHLRGTVFVLKLLGMHQQALQEAIDSNDISLAKEIAQNESLSSEVRRHLWLKIAQHVIGDGTDMQEATNLLRECPLLKLEDLLPYFHDFVTIDQFKDAICASLDSYHQRIEEVKRDIHVTMQCSNTLRKHLESFRNQYHKVDIDSRCAHCSQLLLVRAFYLFPCGHYFHANCLMAQVEPHLSAEEMAELDRLLNAQQMNSQASLADFQDKLDQLVAADCPSCGRQAIANVANLFFPNEAAYKTELSIWQ